MIKRLVIFGVSSWLSAQAFAQAEEQEANLKAAFIYNFTRYTDWDTTGTETNFIIGVMGSSPIVAPLRKIAEHNFVKNRKITLRVFARPEDIRFCHILFIPQTFSFGLAEVLNMTDKNMLTISEEPGYARRGTAINFVLVNNKLKFEINLNAVSKSGLRMSAQLLKLAIIVD